MRDLWDDNLSLINSAFSLCNGVHFETPILPTTKLSYPLKINSWLSGGTERNAPGYNENNGLKMIEMWVDQNRASIKVVNSLDNNLDIASNFSQAPIVLVGWHVDPTPDQSESDYRTMIGLRDDDGDSNNEIVLILTAKSLTIPGSVEVLLNFGVEDNWNPSNRYDNLQIVALDGGSSTQLTAVNSNGEKQEYIRQIRDIPQSIGVFSGRAPSSNIPNYTPVKFTDSNTVYLYSNDQLWPIANETMYCLLGFATDCPGSTPDWSQVVELPASQRTSYTIRSEAIIDPGIPPQKYISYRVTSTNCYQEPIDSSKLYALIAKDGATRFHHISDWDIYVIDMGFSENSTDIVDISLDLFYHYGEGEVINSDNFNFWIAGGTDDDPPSDDPDPSPDPDPPPSTEIGLIATGISDNSIDLGWETDLNPFDYSYIKIRKGTYPIERQYEVHSTAYTYDKMGAGSMACFTVEYYNEQTNTSVISNEACAATTINGQPVEVPTVANLHFESIRSEEIIVTWAPVPGANRYEATRDNPEYTIYVHDPRFSDKGVDPERHYCYAVKACKNTICGRELTICAYTPAIVPPAADFTASVISGYAPLSVQFNNTSSDYDSCSWYFGDGSSSSEVNPTHEYPLPGIYTVSLRVSGPSGSDEVVMTEYITVTEEDLGNGLPEPWQNTDVGNPNLAGSNSYNNGIFTINGSGNDIWQSADQFHYVYQPLSGDGEIVARLLSQDSSEGWAKAGIMIKETASAGANYALLAVTPSNGVTFQYNFYNHESGGTYTFPNAWVKLVRKSNNITASFSPDGISWSEISSTTIMMTTDVTIGLFVTSHNGTVMDTAVFDNVSINGPASIGDPPEPWQLVDIDNPSTVGTATYDPNIGEYTINGSGHDIWGTGGQYTFLHQPLTGDGEIIIRIKRQDNTGGWAKAGVMMSASTVKDADYALMALTPNNGYAFQYNYYGHTSGGGYSFPNAWVKLTRVADTFIGYNSSDGQNWNLVGSINISMPTDVHVGIAVTSNNSSQVCTVAFDNVVVSETAPSSGLPNPWQNSDIGNPNLSGSASYSPTNGFFTINGSGHDIWNDTDQFHYVYQPLSGDGEIVARLLSQDSSEGWAKAGIMIKETASAGANYALLAVTPSNGVAFQYSFYNHESGGTYTFPNAWIKLVRDDDLFTAYSSSDGQSWMVVGSTAIAMATDVTIGLFVTSHNSGIVDTAEFDNVTIINQTANAEGLELLDDPWNLSGNNGSDEEYQAVNQNILDGMKSITITYDLNGICALGGDASAIIFDQNGWQYISLSDYGTNCYNGEQTVTIPLSDFSDLDTESPLTGLLHVRFWYGSAFEVDIISIKVNTSTNNP